MKLEDFWDYVDKKSNIEINIEKTSSIGYTQKTNIVSIVVEKE
jgi:hypothetical protein